MIMGLILLIACQSSAGPLDAVRVNYAGIRAEVTFIYESGTIDREALTNGRIWSMKELGFREQRGRRVAGRWGCDGSSEHAITGPASDPDTSDLSQASGMLSSNPKPIEAIGDGETAAWYMAADHPISLQVARSQTLPFVHHTPFLWMGVKPFPLFLLDENSGNMPVRSTGMRGGYAVELETYKSKIPRGWTQSEVAYDPSVGYLPRYFKGMAEGIGAGDLNVAVGKEMFLLEARVSSGGGFVPTEWCVVSYSVKEFPLKGGKVDDTAQLYPKDSRIAFEHFKANSFTDIIPPVRLEKLEKVQEVAGIGGTVPFRAGSRLLSLDDVKRVVGQKKLTEPAIYSMAKIDRSELNDWESKRGPRWPIYIGAIVSALIMAILVIRHKRSQATLLLGFMVLSVGCDKKATEPVVHLSATFAPDKLVYDPQTPWYRATLVITNDGSDQVRLIEVSGGCTCRKVDRSQLPKALKPGKSMKLVVELRDRGQYDRQAIVIEMQTDRGTFFSPTSLHALPSHHLSPESIAYNGLYEGTEQNFEVIHRAIFPRRQRPDGVLVASGGLGVVEGSVKTGQVGSDPRYNYQDTTYRINLKAVSNGTHKESITIKDKLGHTIVEAPVLWTFTCSVENL